MEQHYLEPDLYIQGVRFTEFSIALTSLLVTLVCLYAWLRLGRREQQGEHRLMRFFFLMMGLSTLVGGLAGHAFLYCLPFVAKTPGWVLGMLAVSGLAQNTIQRVKPTLGDAKTLILTRINLTEFLVALGFLFSTLWFPVVEIHSAFCLLILVGSLEIWLYRKTNFRSSLYFLWSILFAVAAAGVHVAKFSLGTWITFFDIGHVLMCGTIWMILRAAEISTTEGSEQAV
ncbi:MAG: hypothetical protein ABIO24_13280 [Saprospiraceae bacterium]